MLSHLIVCFMLFGVTVAEIELTLTRYKDSTSLSTGQNQVSILTLEYLWTKPWSSVEVSGDWASYYTLGCIPKVFPSGELPEEDRKWFQRAYNRAYGDDTFLPGQKMSEPEIYKFKNGILQSSLGGGENFVSYVMNDNLRVFLFDEIIFLATWDNMPDDLAYIWVEKYDVAYVKRSGEIVFTQERCHQEEIGRLAQSLRKTIELHSQSGHKLLSYLTLKFNDLKYSFSADVRDTLNVMSESESTEEMRFETHIDRILSPTSES